MTSKEQAPRPPHDLALPKITIQMLADYGQEGFLEKTEPAAEGVAGVGWSQAAVDFACEIVRPAVWAEIERLRADNERLMHHVRASPSLSNQYVRLAETEITAQRRRADDLQRALSTDRSVGETSARLTDDQCESVIADLEIEEWNGISKDDVRMWARFIDAARFSEETTSTPPPALSDHEPHGKTAKEGQPAAGVDPTPEHLLKQGYRSGKSEEKASLPRIWIDIEGNSHTWYCGKNPNRVGGITMVTDCTCGAVNGKGD